MLQMFWIVNSDTDTSSDHEIVDSQNTYTYVRRILIMIWCDMWKCSIIYMICEDVYYANLCKVTK